MAESSVVIVGAGVFGVTAALELRRRGRRVVLLDEGPVPHPLAASTDISKAVRLDYGTDEDYTALMEDALDGWTRWNTEWPEPLFHPTGVLFLRRTAIGPGLFEGESFRLLLARGHHPRKLARAEIERLYPAWRDGALGHGYFNPEGGYAESGRVVAWLVERARKEGVEVRERCVLESLLEAGSRVSGVIAADGARVEGDEVVVCAGAWTPHVLPWLAGSMRSNGMPVFHLRPDDPGPFRPERFPVFCADITTTGYYGFPLGREGVVKIANHGPGRSMRPDSPARVVTEEETNALRAFLAESLPALADAPIVGTRVCLYCDTWDGHLWIARDPEREGLTVAAGDSGHAFKFAPVLGGIIADAVEGRSNPILPKFRWRPESRPDRSAEAARRQN